MINRAGCAIVALNRNDPYLVLLGKRTKSPGSGLWVLPGGKVEDGESTTDCVKREAFEEVNLSLTDPRPCYHNWLPDNGGLLMLYFTETVSPTDVRLKANQEFSELRWFDAHDLPEQMWTPDVEAIFAAFRTVGVEFSL